MRANLSSSDCRENLRLVAAPLQKCLLPSWRSQSRYYLRYFQIFKNPTHTSIPWQCWVSFFNSTYTKKICQSIRPTPQQTTPKNRYRGASIVILIPLTLLTVAVILIKIGISTIIPLIVSLMRFTNSIYTDIDTDTDCGKSSIECPLVVA